MSCIQDYRLADAMAADGKAPENAPFGSGSPSIAKYRQVDMDIVSTVDDLGSMNLESSSTLTNSG